VLQQLRSTLPATTALWAGGSGVARLSNDNATLIATLDGAIATLGAWREQQG
jgi:hypothetical protein